MLYRAAMVVVAVFWVAMWGLLIRSELRPQATGLREVPPELVLRQVFQQGQASDLAIRSGGQRLGHVRISPKVDEETGAHSVELVGNLQVKAPGDIPHQHASWTFALEMSADYAVERLRGNVVVRPPGFRSAPLSSLQLRMEPPRNAGYYRLAFGDGPATEAEFTLDQAGLKSLLQQWGIDPRFMQAASPAGITVAPQVTARLTRLIANNEQLETYEVTVQNQGQTLLEMHVSQLGQLLQVKTLLGWELLAE